MLTNLGFQSRLKGGCLRMVVVFAEIINAFWKKCSFCNESRLLVNVFTGGPHLTLFRTRWIRFTSSHQIWSIFILYSRHHLGVPNGYIHLFWLNIYEFVVGLSYTCYISADLVSRLFRSPWYQWYTLLWNWWNYSFVHVLHLCPSYLDLPDASGTQH